MGLWANILLGECCDVIRGNDEGQNRHSTLVHAPHAGGWRSKTGKLALEFLVRFCRGKFLGRIYLHSNCKWKCKSNAITRELRENPKEWKTTVQRGRENPSNQKDHKKFSLFYYKFYFFRVWSPVSRKRSTLIAESWRVVSWSPRSPHMDQPTIVIARNGPATIGRVVRDLRRSRCLVRITARILNHCPPRAELL